MHVKSLSAYILNTSRFPIRCFSTKTPGEKGIKQDSKKQLVLFGSAPDDVWRSQCSGLLDYYFSPDDDDDDLTGTPVPRHSVCLHTYLGMWLFRGAQSAVFYYAACTPCAQYHDRRKRKKDATRIARDPSRDALVTDQPVFFHQPVPFSTNAYWGEEIALGPGPPSRKAVRNGTVRVESRRNLALPETPSDPSSLMKVEDVAASAKKDKDKDGDKDGSRNPLSDRWNRLRYQREDEDLWGIELKGSSVGLTGRGRSDTADSSKYYVARIPEVNDLHPPVVCGPKTREETRWMLQPPPTAKVMEGKVRCEPSQRSRTASPRSSPKISIRASQPTPPSTEKDSRQTPTQTNPSSDLDILSRNASSPSAQPRSRSNTDGSYFPSRQPQPLPTAIPDSTTIAAKEDASLRSHSPSPTTIASTSPPVTYTLEGRDDFYETPFPPPLISRSNSPSSPPLRPSEPKRQDGAADRPWSNGTADSGKAFHPATSSALWGLDYRQPYRVGIHDGTDGISNDDIKELHRIRPYRWSMDF